MSARSVGNVVALHPTPRVDGDGQLDLTNPLHQLRVYRRLSREWRGAMTDRELSAALMLVDMTVGFGRLSYRFTYRSLIEGIGGFRGLGKDERQVREIIRALERKGAITIGANKRDGLDITVNLGWSPKILPTPKRKTEGNPLTGPGETPRADRGISQGQTGGKPHPYIVHTPRTLPQNILAVAGSADPADVRLSEEDQGSGEVEAVPTGPILPVPARSFDHVRKRVRPTPAVQPVSNPPEQLPLPARDMGITAVIALTEAQAKARQKIAEKADRMRRSPQALYRTWQRAWGEAFASIPGAVCPAFGQREAGMLHSLGKKWQGTNAEFHDFIEFVVLEWPALRHHCFKWMREPGCPDMPQFWMLARFHDHMLSVFRGNELNKHLDSLTGEERTRRHLMLKEGKSLEEANLFLAEDRAHRKLRDEMEAAQAKASATLKEARLEAERAEHERRIGIAVAARPKPEPPKPLHHPTDEEWAEDMRKFNEFMEAEKGRGLE